MAIDNKDKKVLKSSIEREQNELACSAEREKIKGSKNLNVPHLRFPEFTKEWEMASLQDIAAVNPKSNPLQNSFVYIDLEAVEKGELRKIQEVMREEAPSRAQRVIYKNDILFQCVRPYQKNNYIHKIQSKSNQQWVASTGYAQIRTTEIPNYIYHLLNTDGFNRKVMVRCTGSSYPAINSEDLATIRFYLTTDTKEQLKISRLLDLLDERIATQNKIIDKLQSLIKGLVDSLLENPSWEKVYLRSFMQFYSTNSLSWEQLSYSNGNVRNLHYGLIHGFQTSMIDSTLLPRILPNYLPKQYTVCQDGDVVFADASENTNEIGKAIEFSNTIDVKTVCGLHTIHGRDIKQNTILGFKGFAFNSRYFHDQVRRLAQGTKVYSITAKNLSSCYVYIPDMIKQENVVRLLNVYEENLSLNRTLLNKYEIQKQYLLQQMLI